jgi:hypothetical protein
VVHHRLRRSGKQEAGAMHPRISTYLATPADAYNVKPDHLLLPSSSATD